MLLNLIIALTVFVVPIHAETSSLIELDKPYNLSQSALQYRYFNVSLNYPSQLILITIVSEQTTPIAIYVASSWDSSMNPYPTALTATTSCFYMNLQTCVIDVPSTEQLNQNATIYFSISLGEQASYTLQVSSTNLYEIKVGKKYKVDFTKKQTAAALSLPVSEMQSSEGVNIKVSYSISGQANTFGMYAYEGSQYNSNLPLLRSDILGAFAQLLKLPSIDKPYTIIIEGALGSVLELDVKATDMNTTKLQLNQTIFDVTNGPNQLCFYNQPFDIDSLERNLYVNMATLSGYGVFHFNYCDDPQFTKVDFSNTNGDNFQIIIPKSNRKKCYNSKSNSGQLLIETLEILIDMVPMDMSFYIAIYEDLQPLTISLDQEQFGSIAEGNGTRIYDLVATANSIQERIQVQILTDQCSATIVLLDCFTNLFMKESCLAINASLSNTNVEYLWTPASKHFYRLNITKSCDSILKYVMSLSVSHFTQKQLALGKMVNQIVEQKQTLYFYLNFSRVTARDHVTIQNGSKITIILSVSNGEAILLTSLTQKYPNYQDAFIPNSQVDFWWTDDAIYILNQTTQALYISVYGYTQSLFHLQINIDIDADVPQKYTKLVANVVSDITLTPSNPYSLLSFSSKQTGYKITFKPTPSCIKYSASLPMTSYCGSVPNTIDSLNIFFNISNPIVAPKQSFKFSVYVQVQDKELKQGQPMFISCDQACTFNIKAHLQQAAMIVHSGYGYVAVALNPNQTYSSQSFSVECQSQQYPCTLILQASLPPSSYMSLSFLEDSSDLIEWRTQPLSLSNLPKKLHLRVSKWISDNSFILLSEAMSLTVYYNIYLINQKMQSYQQYIYPNSSDYMGVSYGDPLRRTHVVLLNSSLLDSLGCYNLQNDCIATILIDANRSVEYSQTYEQSGFAFYSSNTYNYQIIPNSPYIFSQQVSLSFFNVSIPESMNISGMMRINLQPLSTCHPILYFQNQTFYAGATLPFKKTLQFEVTADIACTFYLTVETTPYPQFIAQRSYSVSTTNKSVIFVYKLSGTQNITVIVVPEKGKIEGIFGSVLTFDSGISVPNAKKNLFSSLNEEVSIFPGLQANTYLIKCDFNTETTAKITVISDINSPVILSNNQIVNLKLTSEEQINYKFYSNSQFSLYAAVDLGAVSLTVVRNYDQVVLNEYITSLSQNWYKIGASSDSVAEYKITTKLVLLKTSDNLRDGNNDQNTYPTFTLQSIETGTNGIPQLYEGVALQDALVSASTTLFYKYKSGLILGRQAIIFDLIFSAPISNLLVTISTQQGVSDRKVLRVSAYGFRVVTSYKTNSTYRIGISSNSIQNQSIPFYILIVDPQMQHIADNLTFIAQEFNAYQIFEYVSLQPQTQAITIINCNGSTHLFGSNSYQQAQKGTFSQIGQNWFNSDKSISVINLTKGYYYFGAKSANSSVFEISMQKTTPNYTIMYSKWKLYKPVIQNIFVSEGELIIEMPPLINTTNQYIPIILYTYTLNILDTSYYHPYELKTLTKCPSLGGVTIVRKISGHEFTSFIFFRIPLHELPSRFNVSGRAQIQLSSQNVTYYYDQKHVAIEITVPQGLISFSLVVTTLILIGLMAISSLIIFARRWRLRQNNVIAFQMTTLSQPGPNQTIVQPQANITQPSVRPTNLTGYGQFVDESQ